MEVMLLRIEKGKDLRIREKDIDIVAYPMIDLQHHRCAATERPIFDDFFSALTCRIIAQAMRNSCAQSD